MTYNQLPGEIRDKEKYSCKMCVNKIIRTQPWHNRPVEDYVNCGINTLDAIKHVRYIDDWCWRFSPSPVKSKPPEIVSQFSQRSEVEFKSRRAPQPASPSILDLESSDNQSKST